MSISIFYLPSYKDMVHVSEYCYLKGKAGSCHENELEEFLPIWKKLTSGKFPGSVMNLKKRILDAEYSMYPIVFITSEYWPADGEKKAHGSTCIHVVQKQNQNLKNCKSYDHRYIDRETGVIILEKTKLHDGVKEPDFKFWFYERDNRSALPKEVLKAKFTQVDIMKNEKADGYFLTIEKLKTLPDSLTLTGNYCNMDDYEYNYEKRYAYLQGEVVDWMMKEHTVSTSRTRSFSLIEWDDSWNFVVQDEFGSTMFKVSTEDALEFLTRNEVF